MYDRLRTDDGRSLSGCRVVLDNYRKTSDCASSLGWFPYYDSTNVVASGTFRTMTDVVVPGFKKKQASGAVFFNQMSAQSQTISPGSGSSLGEVEVIPAACSGTSNAYHPRYRGSYVAGSAGLAQSRFKFNLDPNGRLLLPAYLDSEAVNSAYVEASTKLAAQRGTSQGNLWEAIAEVDKSAGMFSQAAQNAVRFASSAKGLRVLRACKAAGNLYLLYRYGFKPLVSDLNTALKSLSKARGQVRGTTRALTTLDLSSQFSESRELWGTFSATATYVTRERYVFRATSLDEYDATAAYNAGFSCKQLLTLPWELIPYSFVVDWFINMGDLINSLVPAVGWRQLGACVTMERIRTDEFTLGGFSLYNPTYFRVVRPPDPSGCAQTIRDKIRGPCAAPALVIKSDFRFGSMTRVGDAIALLLQHIH